MLKNDEFLMVSESFYSIQGEGKSCGKLSVFLRMTGCNLTCSGYSYEKNGKHLGCDSKETWQTGDKYTFDELFDAWKKNGWVEAIKQGAHVILTGGEPLLHQAKLVKWLTYLNKKLPDTTVFVEVETNGTIKPSQAFVKLVSQFNVSPKLGINGDPLEKRWKPDVLQSFVALPEANFKFVVKSKADVIEIEQFFIEAFNVDRERVWLMPEGGTKKKIDDGMKQVVEWSKLYCFNLSPRLQVTIWDEVTGV